MNTAPALLRWLTCAGVTVTMLMGAGTAGAQGQGAAAPAQVPLSGRTAPAGTVATSQTAVPGVTGSVNTLNPTVLVQGALGGSSRRGAPLAGPLTLSEALRRGVEYNLGFLNVNQVIEQARGQRTVARGALLPNVTSDMTATRQQVNLAALGVRISSPIPGFEFPSIVGPFNTFDVRARVSQNVLDLTALNNYRASTEIVKANELSAEDLHNLVVLAVGGSYLQA